MGGRMYFNGHLVDHNLVDGEWNDVFELTESLPQKKNIDTFTKIAHTIHPQIQLNLKQTIDRPF